MSIPQILVIEDESDIAQLIAMHVSKLPSEIKVVPDGKLALIQAKQIHWDAIILDLGLPSMNGLDICRELRNAKIATPILILSARDGEIDRVLGLELGADDYLIKPFSVLELQARVKALIRRAAYGQSNDNDELIFGSLKINRKQRRTWLGDSELSLTAKEFDLLYFFASHPERAFSREELLNEVWGYTHDGYDHTVNSHINRLRSKLPANKASNFQIQTVWGIGYRFGSPP